MTVVGGDPQIAEHMRRWQCQQRGVIGNYAPDDDRRAHWSLAAYLTLRSRCTLRTLRAGTHRALHTLRPGRSLRSSSPLAALRTLGSRLASLALRTLDALRAVAGLIAG